MRKLEQHILSWELKKMQQMKISKKHGEMRLRSIIQIVVVMKAIPKDEIFL